MGRKMKDSGVEWIGDIPENWDTIKVKYTSWLKGRIGWDGLKSSEYTEEGPYLITGVNFKNGAIDWDSCVHISKKRFDEDSDIHILEKDLLITKDGTVGKVAIADNCPTEVSLNSGVLLIRNIKDFKYYDRYLYYVLISDVFWRWYQLSQTGQSTIKHLYQEQFYNFEYTYPKIEEQHRIASFLDQQCAEIDNVLQKTRESIEEYKKLKQAVITQAVTKGIRGDRKMKDSGIEWIGEIPEEWDISKIKYGVTKVGSGKTPKGGAESYADQGILFLRSQNIYNTGLLLDSPTYITPAVDEEMKNTRVLANDVLLNITGGSIGRCCIFPDHISAANVNQHVSIIRVVKDVFLPEYMHYYWMSHLGKLSISLLQTGGNREGMSADAIKNSYIPFIPIYEQNEIIKYLDSKCHEIDNLIEKKEKLSSELESYKKSLIYEYITGKKEVPENYGN